jgi:hypothetical protein
MKRQFLALSTLYYQLERRTPPTFGLHPSKTLNDTDTLGLLIGFSLSVSYLSLCGEIVEAVPATGSSS